MKRRILVLGSTGSIGTQALEVIADNPDLFELVGIAAGGSQPDLLRRQIQQFDLSEEQISVGRPAELVRRVECDVVLNALVGSMGLESTLAALDAGRILALANKESLVAGGQLVIERGGTIVPVDSEHSAMAQCLRSGSRDEVAEFVLTASGGPFRGWSRAELMDVTPEQAAQHPTWSMGQMNTLNSATLVNKGLELIEATLLFGIPADTITVAVHPQSIVHSMITFRDGATIAQASPPSMKLPISLALGWPQRVADAQPALDFSTASRWEFEPLDDDVFPAVRLAREAAAAGGMMGAVYNAANEEAAAEFLAGRLRFPHIVDVVEQVMAEATYAAAAPGCYKDVLECEKQARAAARRACGQL